MDGYVLLDAGGGRRLERFGPHVTDRPAPGATEPPGWGPHRWVVADLRFERTDAGPGRWVRGARTGPWTLALEGLALELRPAAGGQVGLFGEQVALWPWLRGAVGARLGRGVVPEVLSLFAYTGGATLTLAAAGARVVHVDASRTVVAWARRNADASGLGDRPIRWLEDDATAFVHRERRRGRRYDGFVLDPPTYGHGARGAGTWRVGADLPPLLDAIADLSAAEGFGLLTAHTPGLDGPALDSLVRRHLGVATDHGELVLRAASGARLPLGSFARWGAPT